MVVNTQLRFRDVLNSGRPIVFDGGMGTALYEMGYFINRYLFFDTFVRVENSRIHTEYAQRVKQRNQKALQVELTLTWVERLMIPISKPNILSAAKSLFFLQHFTYFCLFVLFFFFCLLKHLLLLAMKSLSFLLLCLSFHTCLYLLATVFQLALINEFWLLKMSCGITVFMRAQWLYGFVAS